MYLGRIVEIGNADEVLQNPRHPYTDVLMWATPDLDPESESIEEPPVRKIDIPDPANPPQGCRFHTRCPEAREICRRQTPALQSVESEGGQKAAWFRVYDESHEYWESPPLE